MPCRERVQLLGGLSRINYFRRPTAGSKRRNRGRFSVLGDVLQAVCSHVPPAFHALACHGIGRKAAPSAIYAAWPLELPP